MKIHIGQKSSWDDANKILEELLPSIKDKELQKIALSCFKKLELSDNTTPEWVVVTQEGSHIDLIWDADLVSLTSDSSWWKEEAI